SDRIGSRNGPRRRGRVRTVGLRRVLRRERAETPARRRREMTSWPVDRDQWLRLGVALVAAIGVFTAIGLVVTDLLAPNFITRVDADVAEQLASMRTPLQDDLAHWGAFLASTPVKIG